ncbi:MAG: hypothetical protein Q8P50_03820 [Bacillota bacterium]|nr:hypothetical protein [Bacillota bacterium]
MKTRMKVALDGYQPLFERLFSLGVHTAWERYERIVPQNRLASSGLFCHDCLDGPCHCDPLGKGSRFGVCGRTPLEMAGAWLALTAARGFIRRLAGIDDRLPGTDTVPAPVLSLISMVSRYRMDMGALGATLRDAALATAVTEGNEADAEPALGTGRVRCGLGARNPLRPAVLLDGLSGTVARSMAESLADTGLECVLSGGERDGFSVGLPVICPSSLAGTVVLAGGVDAVITGDRSYARVMAQEDLDVQAPVFYASNFRTGDVVRAAKRHFSDYPPVPLTGRVVEWDGFEEPSAGYLIVTGGLGVKRTCGESTIRITEMALKAGFTVLALGDSASVLGEVGLMGSGGRCVPADNPAGVGWALALLRDRAFTRPVFVALPEATRTRDIALALEFASLGAPTYLGTVLPVWGPGLAAVLGWNGGSGLPLVNYASEEPLEIIWDKLVSMPSTTWSPK